jgi:hypothetical protein
MTQSLQDLIQDGSGPDRELDALVMCELRLPHYEGGAYFLEWANDGSTFEGDYWWRGKDGKMLLHKAPHFTDKIIGPGECIALVERELPGTRIKMEKVPTNKYWWVWLDEPPPSYHKDLPRAILLALLKAIEGREQG